ncbi:MAG: lysozyme [Solirubrobacteraceae bacterium]|jgi:GH24 family phage-related lysozyme (muramidase)|nr:lysozyme [Solirubrobacteraceae bacterium]
MNISPAGVTLIKEFEGFPNGGHPYQDIVGVWTIGYGHIEGVEPHSPVLTESQASTLLAQDLDKKYGPAVNALGLSLAQHQFDALVSFVYNVGPGGVAPTTRVGAALRARNWQSAADHLLDWDKAGGRSVAGLTRRRQAERALFLSADDPLAGYPDSERQWIHEYDGLVRNNQNPGRRAQLRALMADQRKKIWRVAQPEVKGGDGHGWDVHARRARYASLLARTS